MGWRLAGIAPFLTAMWVAWASLDRPYAKLYIIQRVFSLAVAACDAC
jgi:hypothetical protein